MRMRQAQMGKKEKKEKKKDKKEKDKKDRRRASRRRMHRFSDVSRAVFFLSPCLKRPCFEVRLCRCTSRAVSQVCSP